MHQLKRVVVYIFTKPQHSIEVRHNIVQYIIYNILFTHMRSPFIIITVNVINPNVYYTYIVIKKRKYRLYNAHTLI